MNVFSLQYAVRESAKAAGFWNKAPELKNIPAGELCLFYKHVSVCIYTKICVVVLVTLLNIVYAK